MIVGKFTRITVEMDIEDANFLHSVLRNYEEKVLLPRVVEGKKMKKIPTWSIFIA
jgi:hypothetical protein